MADCATVILAKPLRLARSKRTVTIMTNLEAVRVFAELLNAYDRDEHGDYFYDHGAEVCEAAILAYGLFFEADARGHWVGLEYDGYADGFPVYDLWMCSNCGEEVRGEDVPDTHPYCHGCGIKMIEYNTEVNGG